MSGAASARLRLVSWNVRHCRGVDQRVVPARVLELLGPLDADVIALQEIDVGRARSGRIDQPTWLADRLAMRVIFCETIGGYGHALLSRHPVESSRRVTLPGICPVSEPRAALDARLDIGEPGHLRVLATHLGLSAPDRTTQARAIAALLASSDEPTTLLGDLNAGPRELGYVELVRALRDPLAGAMPHRARCTWPALYPFRALDHVLLAPELATRSVVVLDRGLARFASDHRPVVADAVLVRGASGTSIADSEQ